MSIDLAFPQQLRAMNRITRLCITSFLFFWTNPSFGFVPITRNTVKSHPLQQISLEERDSVRKGKPLRNIASKTAYYECGSEEDVSFVTDNQQVSRSGFLALSAASFMLLGTALPSSVEAVSLPSETSKHEAGQNNNIQASSEMLSKETKYGKTFEESVSGFIAGASVSTSKTLVKYPLDTATVRLQMPETKYSIFELASLFKGSFRGVSAPLLSNIPGGAVFFAVKDVTKASLNGSGLPRWLSTSLAVAAGQIPYWLIRNPSEVVKTRQQAKIEGYGEDVSTLDAFRLVREEAKKDANDSGISGLYAGYQENILYALPADVIKFVCYENVTKGRKDLSPLEGAVAGAASTAIAQLITTPLDVVRNRIMAGEEQSPRENEEKPDSYLEKLSTLAKQEGIQGLFAGASPRVGKAILSGAIQFATYEETKQDIAKIFSKR